MSPPRRYPGRVSKAWIRDHGLAVTPGGSRRSPGSNVWGREPHGSCIAPRKSVLVDNGRGVIGDRDLQLGRGGQHASHRCSDLGRIGDDAALTKVHIGLAVKNVFLPLTDHLVGWSHSFCGASRALDQDACCCQVGRKLFPPVPGPFMVVLSRSLQGALQGHPPGHPAGRRSTRVPSTFVGKRLAWGEAWQETGRVFTREDGSGIHPASVSELFARLSFQAGLPPIRLHDLRHGAATLALSAGVDMKIVSAMLRHSSLSITADLHHRHARGGPRGGRGYRRAGPPEGRRGGGV